METKYIKIDTQSADFDEKFSKYEESISYILQNSYEDFYGFDYHKRRMTEGKSIIYLAFTNEILIGVSYVKQNKRRAVTAVFPEKYRGQGIAKFLVKLSLKDFPQQYSIISTNLNHSHIMINILKKIGFKKVETEEQIKMIVEEEYGLLENFRKENGYLLFDRKSNRRNNKRESLTLLYI